MPDFELEQSFNGPVCGLDEVGRGPLAGPVVAACVFIPENLYALPFVPAIKDSKKLSPVQLEKLYALITQNFIWTVAEIPPATIDEINILQASLRAMAEALDKTAHEFVHALVDGNKLPKLGYRHPATVMIEMTATTNIAIDIESPRGARWSNVLTNL